MPSRAMAALLAAAGIVVLCGFRLLGRDLRKAAAGHGWARPLIAAGLTMLAWLGVTLPQHDASASVATLSITASTGASTWCYAYIQVPEHLPSMPLLEFELRILALERQWDSLGKSTLTIRLAALKADLAQMKKQYTMAELDTSLLGLEQLNARLANAQTQPVTGSRPAGTLPAGH